jgi:lysophospholipase L1-like esterase
MRARIALVTAVLAMLGLGGCAASGGTTMGSPDPDPAPPSAVRGDAPAGTRVAFYGDSYTLGTGASSKAKRWSTVVCEQRGWVEFNPSVNGLGFINNRSVFGAGDLPELIIADKPELVFVTMGLNDNFSYGIAKGAIRKQITADLTRLRSALPDARFVVVEPFWYTDSRPRSLQVISGWVRDAASAIHADYIPGASHWIEHHPEWMASDRLHPNDLGYARMAERMNEELAKLGL